MLAVKAAGWLHPTIEDEIQRAKMASFTAWFDRQLAAATVQLVDDIVQILIEYASVAVCEMFMAENLADAYRPEGLTPL